MNEVGELLSFKVTTGNMDDRKPVELMSNRIFGKLFGDKGYISAELYERLKEKSIELITSLKTNMKGKLMSIMDKLLLRKRSIIETINDILKNSCCINHTRHRNSDNFLINLVSGLIAYCTMPKKPSIKWTKEEKEILTQIVGTQFIEA